MVAGPRRQSGVASTGIVMAPNIALPGDNPHPTIAKSAPVTPRAAARPGLLPPLGSYRDRLSLFGAAFIRRTISSTEHTTRSHRAPSNENAVAKACLFAVTVLFMT